MDYTYNWIMASINPVDSHRVSHLPSDFRAPSTPLASLS
jgi:hypothetical protein